MTEVKYTVRNMIKDDLPKTLDVWQESGMNYGISSLLTWLEVDPEAIKIAVTDEGEVIGACAATIQNEDLVYLALYCVREKYRGLGIGLKIWSACMEHIAHRNACVYAVPEKADLYRNRGGFPIFESNWTAIVYRTNSPVNADKLSHVSPEGIDIELCKESHLPLIYNYDQKLTGYDRQLPIKLISKEPESVTYVAVKNGECAGFGIIRLSCRKNAIIGPLYADDKQVAEVILKKLILSLPQVKGLFMMALSNNDAANELVKRTGCPAVAKCLRLYRKKPANEVDQSKIYGILDSNFSPF